MNRFDRETETHDVFLWKLQFKVLSDEILKRVQSASLF